MKLLDKLQYLSLIKESPEKILPTSENILSILKISEKVFDALDLKRRKLSIKDVTTIFRHNDFLFYHIKAYPRKDPETQVIIIVDTNNQCEGYILIDFLSEYTRPLLECPSLDFEDVVTKEDIELLIPKIDINDNDPFAILSTGEGTYMQTMKTDEGFILEHQLVNHRCHYEAVGNLSVEQVIAAMVSYAFGKHEWLETIQWRHQQI